MSSYYASTSILFLLNLVKLNFKIKCAVTIIPFTVSMNIKTFILQTEKLFCIKKFACSENKVELDKNKCFLDNLHQPPSNFAFIGPKLKILFFDMDFSIHHHYNLIYLKQSHGNLKVTAAWMWWTHCCIKFDENIQQIFYFCLLATKICKA